MALTEDDHRIRIEGSEVRVVGSTGLIDPRWRLLIDDVEVDARAETGTFSLAGSLPGGGAIEAQVTQGSFGRTTVALLHEGEEVTRWKGLVM